MLCPVCGKDLCLEIIPKTGEFHYDCPHCFSSLFFKDGECEVLTEGEIPSIGGEGDSPPEETAGRNERKAAPEAGETQETDSSPGTARGAGDKVSLEEQQEVSSPKENRETAVSREDSPQPEGLDKESGGQPSSVEAGETQEADSSPGTARGAGDETSLAGQQESSPKESAGQQVEVGGTNSPSETTPPAGDETSLEEQQPPEAENGSVEKTEPPVLEEEEEDFVSAEDSDKEAAGEESAEKESVESDSTEGKEEDFSDLEEFGATSAPPGKGPFYYTLMISGIDSPDLRKQVEETFEDEALKLSPEMSSIQDGSLKINKISPIQTHVIVKTLMGLPLEISWAQSLVVDEPDEKEE